MGLFGIKNRKKKKHKKDSSTSDALSQFTQGLVDIKDVIAPSAMEIDFNNILIGGKYFRTFFASGYPRFVGSNWLSPLINFERPIDISTFYYPVDSGKVLEQLRRKIAEMEATINLDVESGKIPQAKVKVNLEDAKELQLQLATGEEKYFHFSLYVTVRADTLKELEKISRDIESTLAALGVILKIATLQQEKGFQSSLPAGSDKLYITRNMDTTSIATTFPFTSSELTMEDGIFYGINKGNKSLVIFDRFKAQNANMVVFASSGAGKSYMVKLEVVRSLMFGVEIIIIDPEREYEKLTNAIGGEYISFSQDGAQKLNPFELSGIFDKDEDELRFKILSLHGLIKIMIGGEMTPEESAVLDRALILSYREKGITPDPSTHTKEPPLLEDLYKILKAMAEQEAKKIATRIERYLVGSAAGIFNQATNIEIKNTFTVFSIRELAEEMRPIAMYMMLDYIWTRVKQSRKKRLLVIDEAWWMMQFPDAAKFVHSIAKRARKYALGLTTITQDVEDFLGSDFGKAVVTNSTIQILMKQSPVAIDKLQKLFYLSEGEKGFLLSAGIGEGLFFAGTNHVAIQVIASENEHNLITTNPIEIMAQNADKNKMKNKQNKENTSENTGPKPE